MLILDSHKMEHIYKPCFVCFIFFFMGFKFCHFLLTVSLKFTSYFSIPSVKPNFKTLNLISHGERRCYNKESWWHKLLSDSAFSNGIHRLWGLLTDPTKAFIMIHDIKSLPILSHILFMILFSNLFLCHFSHDPFRCALQFKAVTGAFIQPSWICLVFYP